MQKEEVIEGNDLIAKFMELPYNSSFGYQQKKDIYTPFNRLEYNSSYDWIMPVVDKIESLGYNFRLNSYHENKRCHCNFFKNLVNVLADNDKTYNTKLEAIYSAVVRFIKWHNEQNK